MKGNVWVQVLARLETSVRRHEYYQWLAPTSFASDDGTTIEVRVQNDATSNWIQKQYGTAIAEALSALGRPGAQVTFVVGPPVSLERAQATAGKRLQGKALNWEVIEPWEEPVAGPALLQDVSEAFERYVTLPEHAATALALWVVFTYAQDASYISPILAITSPMKQCGKSTVLAVLSSLVYRQQVASNLTQGVLFRFIDRYAPTLLIDEADTFLPGNDALRGILNSGHTRTTARLIRNIGDDYEPREFTTWCPKAIALIGRLPGTLEDRSIQIQMRRQMPGEKRYRKERCPREDRLASLHLEVRRKLARWADDHLDALHRHGDPEVPSTLSDRMADNWRPLVAIAEVCGGDWPARARTAAAALSGDAFNDDQEPGVELLKDLIILMTPAEDQPGAPPRLQATEGIVPSADIVKALCELPDRPWSAWRGGQPLSPYGLSRLLKPLHIYPAGVQRSTDQTLRGYRQESFDDAFSRYLPIWLIGRNKPNVYGPESQILVDQKEANLINQKSEKQPGFIGLVTPDQPDQGKKGILPIVPAIRKQLARANLRPVPPHHRVPSRTTGTPKGR